MKQASQPAYDVVLPRDAKYANDFQELSQADGMSKEVDSDSTEVNEP